MSPNNSRRGLQPAQKAIASNFLKHDIGKAKGLQIRTDFDARTHSKCRCCLKVKRRSEMLNNEFCDTKCYLEFKMHGFNVVTNNLADDISTCCCCGKEVLVQIDGQFERVFAYRCVGCRSDLREAETEPRSSAPSPCRPSPHSGVWDADEGCW